MKPRGAILVRILLLAILNSLCTNSLSLTTTNSLPEFLPSENRDGNKTKIPITVEDNRPETIHIIQGHETLRIALREFLDQRDSNLTFYLNRLRSQEEPFYDEFGEIITSYKKVMSFISEQVDEVTVGNYAIGHFDKDRHDLCSVARYLSNQVSYAARETIIQRMGDALGSACDPCISYKRKQYSDEIGDTDSIDRTKCLNKTSSVDRVSLQVENFQPYCRFDRSDVITYNPPTSIYCHLSAISDVVKVFQRATTLKLNEGKTLEEFSLIIKTPFLPKDVEEIPPDLIGTYHFRKISISGLKTVYEEEAHLVPLKIDENAFRSTRIHTEVVEISLLDVGALNFSFLTGFSRLAHLKISNIADLYLTFSTLPSQSLISLSKLEIEKCTDLVDTTDDQNSVAWSQFPPPLENGLKELSLSWHEEFDDFTCSRILDWVVLSSTGTLETLTLTNNRWMSGIPAQLASFNKLKRFSAARDAAFPINTVALNLTEGSLRFSSFVKEINLFGRGIKNIQPETFQGNFSLLGTLNLIGNNLDRFESSVFLPIATQLTSLAVDESDNNDDWNFNVGSILMLENPIDCSTDTCHLAWIVRDRPQLLNEVVQGATCSNGTTLQNLNRRLGFNHCPSDD